MDPSHEILSSHPFPMDFINIFGSTDPASIQSGTTIAQMIFSHIRRLGLFFWVQNSEFQYFLGFSEKRIFFWGMKILWIFFGVITKLG